MTSWLTCVIFLFSEYWSCVKWLWLGLLASVAMLMFPFLKSSSVGSIFPLWKNEYPSVSPKSWAQMSVMWSNMWSNVTENFVKHYFEKQCFRKCCEATFWAPKQLFERGPKFCYYNWTLHGFLSYHRMLQCTFEDRPTASACLQHSFFTHKLKPSYKDLLLLPTRILQLDNVTNDQEKGGTTGDYTGNQILYSTQIFIIYEKQLLALNVYCLWLQAIGHFR